MLKPRQPAVYILASGRNGTLYVGVTRDLARRVSEHRAHVKSGFTAKYNVIRLVYYELHADMQTAIAREKQLTAFFVPALNISALRRRQRLRR
jgi:putative endonuclease